MSNWQHYWKAILAFLTLVATNAMTDLMQDGTPWPATGGDWARWGVSILGGTLVVYGKGNAPPKSPAPTAPTDVDSEPPTLPLPVPQPRRRPVI